MQILRKRPIHAERLERWLGPEKLDQMQAMAHGWYGPPLYISGIPGGLWVHPDGDFTGGFTRGGFACALDALRDSVVRFWRRVDREPAYRERMLGAGFTSIDDALSRASQGFRQQWNFGKGGPTGVLGVTSSLWRLTGQPAAGTAPAAAPGGTAPTNATTGAIPITTPAAGTLHLVGADFGASAIQNSLILYDRIFHVLKTMASTATEAVTGVPTRYQSATSTAEDYAGGNFLFIEVGGTALAATAHNWTVCTYTDQDGNAGATLPSVTGNSGAIVDRLDQPLNTWFAPLASGDNGIKALTQMQCSASVATGVINFVIGHPIANLAFPINNMLMPFDWLSGANQTPRIFDGACLAFLEYCKPSTTACTYAGVLSFTNAAA